jgi:hypothetical protein
MNSCEFEEIIISKGLKINITPESKLKFFFDTHIQTHIWLCLKSTFPLTNILKVNTTTGIKGFIS